MAEIYSTPQPEAEDDAGMEVDNPSESEASTALLPNDFFQGKELKPGTECKVRSERVLDGQVEVTYVAHESEEPEVGAEPEPADEEMTSYMET